MTTIDELAEILPAELGVLVALTRPDGLRRFAERADWQLTVALARDHRLLGRLAAASTQPSVEPLIPPKLRQTLRTERHRRGRWFTQLVLPQLQEVCWSLGAEGIDPILLKGAALICSGSVAASQRPMADLDLLINIDQVDAASSVLRQLGYRHRVPRSTVRWARRHHYQDAAWYHPDHRLPVEVHWNVLPPRDRLAFEVHSLVSIELPVPGGPTVRRLDDADQLAHLALHFWRDRRVGTGPPLGQLWDLHEVCATLGSDTWAAVRERAMSRGHLNVLSAVLACETFLLGSPPPPQLPEVAELRDDERLRSFVLRRVLAPRPPALQMLMVTGDVDYTPYRLMTRLLAQATRSHDRLSAVYGPGPRWRLRSRHLRMLGQLLTTLARSGDTREEVRLDHWAHQLSRGP